MGKLRSGRARGRQSARGRRALTNDETASASGPGAGTSPAVPGPLCCWFPYPSSTGILLRQLPAMSSPTRRAWCCSGRGGGRRGGIARHRHHARNTGSASRMPERTPAALPIELPGMEASARPGRDSSPQPWQGQDLNLRAPNPDMRHPGRIEPGLARKGLAADQACSPRCHGQVCRRSLPCSRFHASQNEQESR